MRPRFKKILQFFLVAAGIALFCWTIRVSGVENLLSLVPALHLSSFSFIFIYLFMCFWDVWGWHVLFPPAARISVKFVPLYFVRLAGEAVNSITPFIDIGGEFLKVSLVSRFSGLGRKQVLASVIVERSILFVSEIPFWILGLTCMHFYFPVPEIWRNGAILFVAVFVILGTALGMGLRGGLFSALGNSLRRTALVRGLSERVHVSLQEVDREIDFIHQGRIKEIFFSFWLHFLGWVAGGLETYAIFKILGLPVSWGLCFVLEALLQLLRSGSFFIPGNLGAQEAGLAALFQWMGFHPSLGVALSLLKRLRQLVWTGVGFAVWGVFEASQRKSLQN